MTRSISFSRPITGSSFVSRASWVRFRPNWSRTVDPWGVASPGAASLPPVYPDRSWMTCWRTRFRSAPSFCRTWAATPSPSRIKPRRMCSVPM
jgi:hypothetical protein